MLETNKYPKIIFGDLLWLGQVKKPDPNGLFFIAKDFPIPRKEITWDGFPSDYQVQPKKILRFRQSDYSIPKPISRTDFPNFDEWDNNVKSITTDKVVLARKTTFTFSKKVDPFIFINHLAKHRHNSKLFAFILNPNLAFIGLTPETLFRRYDKKLFTEALAGTRPIEKEEELLSSEKEKREFLFVKQYIASKLKPICKPFTLDEQLLIKRTPNLSHLHYPFNVELASTIPDEELIKILNPTPAMGGYPREAALRQIYELEPFDRGWYSSAIGYKTKTHSEIFVGIRSAIIEENKVHLFAGAGIVSGCSSNHEWFELEKKIGLWGLI